MSIEDPRLSSIDNTSAADDFDSAVEQHLGFSGEAVDGIEVAQAETPEAGRTDRLPAQTPPVQTAAATIPAEVTPNGDNVVTLPAGIELDNLEFQVDGANLVLVLADGTEIVVIGGAANIPTFVIGDVELPQVALFAALEGSNINVAAGPDGSFSAQSTPDGSRNFEDNQIGDGFEEFALAGLLGDTGFGDGQEAGAVEQAGIGPFAGDLGSFGYDEAVLVTEGIDDDIFRGELDFVAGPNFGAITGINLIGLGGLDLAGNVSEPGDDATPYALTSGGAPISIVTQTVAANSTDTSFVAVTGTKQVLVNGVLTTVVVFTLTVTDRVEGLFEFRLFEPLDHADLNEADADDLLRLAFDFTVTDLAGRTATGTFDIDVADDSATISVPVATDAVVEEEQWQVDGWGNEDTSNNEGDGDLDADTVDKDYGSEARGGSFGFQDNTTHRYVGNLGISWGADDLDLSDELDANTLAGLGNRTVSFVVPSTDGSEGGGGEVEVAAKSASAGLTSNGYAVVYEYSADGKTLTAYRYNGEGYLDDRGRVVSGEDMDDARVFEVVLDDNGSGSYTFTLYGTLDHNGDGEDALQLNFQFTATDSDGDTTAPATFSIKVIDDVLEIGRPERETVDEDGRPGLESGAGNPGPIWSDDSSGGTFERGRLNIRWGADDGNSDVNGGFTDQKGDRAVIFDNDAAPEGLTSNGFRLFYAYNDIRTELIAYRVDGEGYFIDSNGERIPVSISEESSLLLRDGGSDEFVRLGDEGEFPTGEARLLSDAAVFEVKLFDSESGSYSFKLLDNLDHKSQGEDNLNLNFNFIARDGDGDQENSSFTVVVDDDTPVFSWFPEEENVAEQSIGETNAVQSGELFVSWGADNANSEVNGGATNLDGDRYVVFRTQSAPTNLTSNGFGLSYVYNATGTELVAYRVNRVGQLVDADGIVIRAGEVPVVIENGVLSENAGEFARDAAVFAVTLSDQGTGSYTFTLIDNLDHVGFGRGSEIDLEFQFKAVDSDGDVLNGSFEVDVRDGGPSLGGNVSSATVDEEGVVGRAGNGGESYPENTGAAADAAGTASSTGEVSLNINWGNDADIKSEGLNQQGQIGTVDDPIGRQVVFAARNGEALGVGTIQNVTSVLGSDFAALKSGAQSLNYRIDYLRDDTGNWNGGYVLTAYTGQNPAANAVFKVTLDPTDDTGSYKFDLLGVLNHPNTGMQMNSENDINLTFGFKAIDSDGDATGRGTFMVTVDDDAPIAGVAVVSGVELRHDETSGVQTGTDDQSQANYSTVPSDFRNLGTVIGWAQQGGMVSTATSSYGADGAGSTTLALTQSNGSSFNGVDSGLQNLAGANIKLFSQDGLVLGKVGNIVYFALQVENNGTVSIAQYQPIKHADSTNPNDFDSIDNVFVTVTVTDRDGDVKSATTTTALDLKIVDDGPSVNPTQTGKTVDEDGLATGNGARIAYAGDAPETDRSVTGTLVYSFGADGKSGAADDIVFDTASLRALNLESLGTPLTYSWNNGNNTLTATAGQYGPTVFTLQVTNVDSGAFTFTLNRALDHSPTTGANTEDDININFGFTIKDGDGDTATGSIVITIDDDAPFIGTPDAERVSEASLPYTLGDELNPDNANSAYQTGNLAISWGADNQDGVLGANRSVAFAAGLTANGLTSDGETIRYEFNSDRTELTAVTGSGFGKEVIFTVKLNDDGTGTYQFRLYGNIDHAPNTSEKLLSFGFVAKDSDGDAASSSFNVTIEDQTASLGAAETKTVDEEFISGSGNTGLEHSYPGDVWFDFTRVTGDLNINWGADDNDTGLTNNRSVQFSGYTNGANFGSVTSDGAQVKVWVSQNGTLYGYVGDNPASESARVFMVTLDDDHSGSYTFTLLGNLDHSATRLEDNLELNFGYTATDSDGDTTLPGQFTVRVNDDAARLTGAENSTVDEDGIGLGNTQLPGANNTQATGDAIGEPLLVTRKSLGIEWGADDNTKSEPLTNGAIGNVDPIGRTVAFADVSANQQGTALAAGTVTAAQLGLGNLSSGGIALVYTITYLQATPGGVWNGGYVLTATKGSPGPEIFKVTLDPTATNGAYSFEVKGPLDHTFGDNTEAGLNLNFKFAAFDADGDPATGIYFSSPISNGQFTVNVNDDSATARNDGYTVAEDSETTSFNGANGLISNDTVGADGATLYQVKLGGGSFVEVTSGTPVNDSYSFVVAGKGTYVFKLNGEWSFTPLANFNGTANFEYKLRDGDGDVSNAATVTVTVTPVNDNPVGVNDAFSVTEAEIAGALIGTKHLVGNVLLNDTDIDNDPLLNFPVGNQTLTVPAYTITIDNGTNTGVVLAVDPTMVDGAYRITGPQGDAYLKVEANGDIKMWTDTGEDPYKALGTTESATITINYTVSDSQNPTAGTATATAVITINGSNDNPDAVDDSFLGGSGGQFFEDFNNADDWTAIKLGSRPNTTSGNWTAANGVVTESDNQADAFFRAPVNALPLGAASSTIYRIEVDADPQNRPEPVAAPPARNEAVGLVFGFADSNNFYRAYWKSYDHNSAVANGGAGAADYRDLVLEKVVNGVVTNLSTVDNVDLGNDMMKFVLTVGPGGIRVEVSGNFETKVLTSTDRPALGGYGLYSEDNDDGITYDNFSITVGGGAITTAEDTALNIQAADLLANDSDVDGDPIEIVSVGGNSTTGTSVNGGVVSLVNGVITYTPAANFNGTDTFTYTISDGKGGTDTATVTINVTPVNDLPVAANDIYSTAEDTPLQVTIANGVLLNDVDVDGDAINAMLETNPAHGTLSFTGAGTFLYTPDANYNGPDSFTYKAYDANGVSNIATVTINVVAVNDAPKIVSTPVQIVNAGFEADTTYTNSGSEGRWGNASPTGWTVSGPGTGAGWFDPTPDGAGGSAGVLPMAAGNGNNVLFLNDGQQAAQTLSATAQAGTYNLSVEVGDRADANLTGLPAYTIRLYAGSTLVGEYSAPAQPANGPAWQTVQLQGVIPAGSALIGQNLRIEIENLEAPGAGGAFEQTVQVNFDNLNLTYIASVPFNAITEDDINNAGQTVASLLGASVTDVDAGAVEGIAVTGADDGNGTWQFKNGNDWVNFGTYTEAGALLLRATDLVRFEPNGDNGTNASFNFVAWDQTSGTALATADVTVRGGTTAFSSETAQATIIVSSVNDAPVISIGLGDSAAQDIPETDSGLTATGTLTVTDVDVADVVRTSITFLEVSGPDYGTNLTHDELNSYFKVTPEAVINGSQTSGSLNWEFDSKNQAFDFLAANTRLVLKYTVTVTDSSGATDTQIVEIGINGTNDAPVISIPSDELNVIYGAEEAVARFLPETDMPLIASGILTVNDVDSGSVVSVEVISVVNESGNDAGPVAKGFLTVTPQLVTDANETPGNLTWNFNSGAETFNFLPLGAETVLAYTIRVTDEKGAVSTQVVAIFINGTEDGPTVSVPQDLITKEDTAIELTGIVIADVDGGENPTITLTATNGKLVYQGGDLRPDGTYTEYTVAQINNMIATGDLKFVPDADFYGQASVTVAVSQPGTGVDTQTFNIDVTPVNDAPVAVDNVLAAVGEDSGVRVINIADILANDSKGPLNEAGQTLTITELTTVVGGTAVIVGDTIEFTPTLNFNGTASFNYVVSDNGQSNGANDFRTDVGTVSFAINAVNDVPTITGATSGTVSEDGTIVTNGTLTIVDPDSGQSGATAATGSATYGTWSINAAGTWTYTLDNTNPLVQALNTAQHVDDYFTVTTADGTPQMISIRINGLNEPALPLAVNEATSADGRFAFSDNFSVYDPRQLNFITQNLFTGGVGPLTYTFQQVQGPDEDWINEGNVVTGNPDGSEFGLYTYQVTATDASGAKVSTYVSFSALSDFGALIQVQNNGGGVDSYGYAQQVFSDRIVIRDTAAPGSLNAGGGSDVVSGNANINTIDGSAGNDTIFGMGGNDTLYGGADGDFIDGGAGNDTIYGDDLINAESGNDVILGGAGNDTIYGGRSADILVGGSGSDQLFGGAGNDLLIGDQQDTVIDGGDGTDTLRISDDFTSSSNGQVVSVERVELTRAATLNLSNQQEGFKIIGSSGADHITGGSGDDTINAGGGNDIVTLSSSNVDSDQIRFATNTGADTVYNFVYGRDKIAFLDGNGTGAVNFGSTNSNDVGAIFGSNDLVQRSAINQITGSHDNKVIVITAQQSEADILANVASAQNSYVIVYNSTANAAQIWFDTDWSSGSLGSRSLVATLYGLTAAQVALLSTSDFRGYNSATDPIILDLDKNGFAFSSIDNGVTFDINADGKGDQIAWTSDDGILAYDVDGNGLIDNGSEIFTPDFNGGKFASGVAALASLDANGDGKIDSGDAAFKDLKIWIDANNNGVSDQGEVSSLSDHGVTSISLTPDTTGGEEDGQTIFADGEFTFADGSTGNFVEVGFDTIFGSDLSDPLTIMGTDGDDVLHGGMGQVVMTGGAGNDTFVFNGTALDDLDVADVITDFNSDGDVLDVTALLDSLLGEQPDATADTHLRATLDGAGNTTVSVQAEPGVWKDVVELQNHDTAIKVLFDDKHTTITPHD